ncbi:1948_t:CDS:2 [Cetraspora pellucida]|uniref:1948_t:CDS:1 n=1 Tax=Cetraspora pellucida TaxID=1433469 RepID=A0ACA9K6M8_9GLOM|nr:1948_t:CDS:2 [Cetraspora pellucida]
MPTEINLDNTSSKTVEVFTRLYNLDLPAHSELIEDRIAVLKLLNFVRSDDPLDIKKKGIRNNLLQLNDHLNILSKSLESIYVNGQLFFFIHEIYISEWEKLSRNNEYFPALFQKMHNQSTEFFNTINLTRYQVNLINTFILSINYEEVMSKCDPLFIEQCKYEFSRIEKISAFLKRSEPNLFESCQSVQNFINHLDHIITVINKNNSRITSSGQTVKNLKTAVNKIRAVHMKFLNSQDTTHQKLYILNDNFENVNGVDNKTIFKSKLVGKSGCQGFETRFSTLPIINGGVYNPRHPQFLRNIRINIGRFIDSFTFEWSDNVSFKYGGNSGILNDLNLDEGELITWAKIYLCYENVPCGLEFRTNKWKTSGILGNKESSYYQSVLEAPNGYVITGLYGGFEKHICGIGIIYSKI